MKRAYECFDELGKTFARHGWGVNRTNAAFMDKVADSYGPAMRRLNRTIKKALDPNNILAPGKSGINLGLTDGRPQQLSARIRSVEGA